MKNAPAKNNDADPANPAPLREVLLLCWRDSDHPQGGGSERYLERIGAELARGGVEVTLRTARYPGAAASEVRDGIKVSRGGGRLGVYPSALMAIALGRFGLGPLAGLRPDVVIDTQNGIPFFARWVAAAPVVVLVHHCHRRQWPVAGALLGKVGWFIESRMSPWVHRRSQYLTVSLPSAEDLERMGIGSERVAVVRAGTDPVPEVASDASGALRLCVLSRLVPHKQIEHALEVMARLSATHPDVALDVIGDGWWSEQLRSHATELGVDDRVVFHGHVSEIDKHRLLAGATLHVMPSRTEGWGLAVVEAAGHGVPTIGYRSSRGLTDSVIDGVTGVLVDNIDELAAATAQLLDDPAWCRELGEKASQRAEGYSWPIAASGVTHVLTEAAAHRRVSGLVQNADR
ncbi:glycosyltransferase involved in cell wall biosynthesis [Williamsia limnetica]|uniref:Glycosyltransferase involved in cell wall biosynthesis n=1 Tax=Williamsia limnetica TaxID=882452 RepID=A0A318RJY0_WILLI|nr:glycosyltransferase involved in cell wall biosynthesis [Williamsia limnetica]